MRKNIFYSFALLLGSLCYGQVGIGTNTPHAGSILHLEGAKKALILPRLANTAAIPVASLKNGMLIYDKSVGCIKIYSNNAWSDCLSK